MRLFIASPISLPTYQTIKEDFKGCIKGKWVEGWNLHLTYKFIGEDDAKKYQKPLNLSKVEIKIKGLGTFSEKVLFLKVTNDLKEINEKINKEFNLSNDKSFIPHITLCRIKEINNKEEFNLKLKKWENFSFSISSEIYLYASTLTKKGPIYKKIYKY